MKKIFKVLTLSLLLLLAFTTTSCSKKRESYKTIEVKADLVDVASTAIEIEAVKNDKELVPEDKQFIGLLKDGVLYVENNGAYPKELKAGTYEIITMPKTSDGVVSLPAIPSTEKGILAFSGWYKTADFNKGERIASTNQLNLATGVTELYVRYISFVDACLVALVCIIIVFAMLALLWGIVSVFKIIAPKEKANSKQENKPVVTAPQKAFTMADITDDDMMAAALVATIDYHNETKKNVKVVSIKEIK